MSLFHFFTRHILEVPFWFASFVLLITLFGNFRREFLRRHAKRIFFYGVFGILAYLILVGALQFEAFRAGPLGNLGFRQFLSYTLGYNQTHYWNEYLVSFVAALLFAGVGYFFNKKYQERFFEKEELYLIALGILLVGYPAFIFYIPLVLLISIIVSAIFVRKGERLPLYHFWAPVALAVLIVTHVWLVNQVWWTSFVF